MILTYDSREKQLKSRINKWGYDVKSLKYGTAILAG
jgi:hypothetical protein